MDLYTARSWLGPPHSVDDQTFCLLKVAGRYSGSRETTRGKSRMQEQSRPGKLERYHWWTRRGEESDLPDLSSFCESHLLHSSGMVLRDVTEY